MKHLSAQKRFHLINEVLRSKKKSVACTCREFGVSRYTFYKWAKICQKRGPQPKIEFFQDHYPKGEKHWRALPSKKKGAILELAVARPHWGSQKIASYLTQNGLKVGNHGVQNVLKRNNLSQAGERQIYQKNQGVETILASRFSPARRLQMIEEVQKGKEKVSAVCRKLGISRYTFYKWYRRYLENPQEWFKALNNKCLKGENHPRFLGPEKERLVLDWVAQNPQYSCRRLSDIIPQVSHHGIQNILERNNLNTYQKRLIFQQSLRPTTTPTFVPAPAPVVTQPPKIWRFLKAPFATVPKVVRSPRTLLLTLFFTLTSSFILYRWILMLSQAPPGTQAGLVFATFALTFGLFFFIYSLKYYFTLVLILGFSRQVNGGNGNQELGIKNQGENRKRSILERLFGVALNGNGQKNGNDDGYGYGQGGVRGGLQPDLSQVKLERYPFVSIHLPIYNEPSVVDRLLTACTGLDYENYEIIVVDDSTDRTTQILRNWQGHPRLKIIHRQNREGFKGGALKVALENTDPRAEFVLVFDADFLPYPDTITQFLKYFQVTAGGLDFSSSSSWRETRLAGRPIGSPGDSIASLQNDTKESPIAAIQGYQWHVLNKSENWITRGVRSEYAGSYVVERSAGEITGALKQIAGSAYMIRKDILDRYSWGTSLTEDFELTLKLYRDGYKVVYTPYIQTPSECVSTLKRLIRQRMRWAEGHSHNIKRMFWQLMWGRWEYQETQTVEDGGLKIGLEDRRLKMENQPSTIHLQTPPSTFHHLSSKTWVPSKLTFMEKLEFLYLSPYYLQALFFMIGTLSWFLSEAVFHTKLPFWTSIWGWSLVFTNLFSLPLMNLVGLFLEESEERDYGGILSFIFLTYILTPFQGYAALKGFLEKQEGPWFRTPKTGLITDIFTRGRFYRWISGIIPGRKLLNPSGYTLNPYVALATANNRFENFFILRKRTKWIGRISLVVLLILSTLLLSLAPAAPYFVKPQEAQAKGFGTIVGPQGNLTQTGKSIDGAYSDGSNLEELKPKEINPSTYAFKTLEGDVIEIGTEKHSPPQPYLKLNKWNNEVSLKVGIPFVTEEKPTVAGDKMTYSTVSNQKETGNRWWQKIIFKLFPLARASTKSQPKMDIEFYPRQPEEITEKDAQGNEHKFTINEQGGVEFDTILYEKPNTNQIVFPIETKGLKFYYQPELTQKEKAEGAFRPENVVGSYAVYHESKSGDYTALGGKNYRAGKAFHIYRPKVCDANNNCIWGELNITIEQDSNLTITIPQDWLENAVYPVTIDPNFGYETAGLSLLNSDLTVQSSGHTRGSVFTGAAGTVTSITAYIKRTTAGNGKGGIYTHSDSSLVTNGATPEASIGTSASWVTFTYSTSPTIAAVDYVLVIGNVYGKYVNAGYYYDAGDTDQGHYQNNAYVPSTATFTHDNNKYSIYATYTAAGVDTSTSANATAYSFQRKTWYDGTRLWSAFYSGTEIEFWYSADWGATWTQNTSATISVSTNDFSIEADSSNAFIAYTNGYDIEARSATTYPGTGFGWSAATIVYDGSSGTDEFDYPAISKDSNSKVWITATHLSGTDYLFKARQGTTANDISAWGTATTLDTSTNSNKYGTIVSLGSGNMYSVWIDGTAIEGKKYGSNTVDKQVGVSGDDGSRTGISFSNSSTTDWIGNTQFGFPPFHIFARWTGVTIAGTITASYVELYADANGTGSPQMKVYGVDEDNAAAPTTDTEFDNDPLTTAAVDWDESFVSGTWEQPSSLNAIFQELVDSYTINNDAVMVQIKNDGVGNNYNVVRTYDNTTSPANTWGAKLHIEYTAWDASPTSIATGVTGLTNNMSAVSDSSGNVHLLYIDSSDYAVYQEYTTSWQTAVTLDSTAGNDYPTISLNTSNNDLYALWIRSNVIYYKKGVSPYASANWDASATSWKATGTNTNTTSNYSGAGMIFAQWTEGTGSPYSVMWDYIIIPEKLWLLLGLGLVIPRLLKTRLRHRLRRAREE